MTIPIIIIIIGGGHPIHNGHMISRLETGANHALTKKTRELGTSEHQNWNSAIIH